MNGGYNRHQIDAYVITRGGGPFNDFSTPIFQLNEENNKHPLRKDNPRYVAWQEAGTAHAPPSSGGATSRASSSATGRRRPASIRSAPPAR